MPFVASANFSRTANFWVSTDKLGTAFLGLKPYRRLRIGNIEKLSDLYPDASEKALSRINHPR